MATPEAAKVVDDGTWELVHAFTGPNYPRGYVVRNKPTSANECQIFILGIHGEVAPTSQEGYSLAVGESSSFHGAVLGGVGAIRAVYAKSANATITHAIAVN